MARSEADPETPRTWPPQLEPEERRRVMDALGMSSGSQALTPFVIMQTLSVVVAVMGLSADSAAVVIGAMLLAPLMTPVLALAASVAMALPSRIWRALAIVTVTSILSVALAYLLAVGLREGPLPDEVLSRTSPDLRDLVVALAAGAAGAYATVRKDVSTSLPGVAVAVALVPPLAVIGITLEAGEYALAQGASLLYAANLASIILVSCGVFLATGFVPPRRLRTQRVRVLGSAALVAVVTLAVAVPLAVASVDAARKGREREAIRQAADNWLEGSGDILETARVEGDTVVIEVSGPNQPPPIVELSRTIKDLMGPSAVAEVRWTQTQAALDAPADEPEATTPADESIAEVQTLIDSWLVAEPSAYDVEEVTVAEDEIRIDLTSANPPPPVDELARSLQDELGLTVPIVVNWTQRTTLASASDPEPGSLAEMDARLTARAIAWAADADDLTVTELDYDGSDITVELVGASPGNPLELELLLLELAGADKQVTIWFTERRQVGTTGN